MASPYQYIVLHQSVRNHPGVIACQAAHAAGESLRAPAASDTHVVALVAEKSHDLVALSLTLREAGIHHALICEPDEPYNGSAVAVGIEPLEDRERVKPLVARFKLFR